MKWFERLTTLRSRLRASPRGSTSAQTSQQQPASPSWRPNYSASHTGWCQRQVSTMNNAGPGGTRMKILDKLSGPLNWVTGRPQVEAANLTPGRLWSQQPGGHQGSLRKSWSGNGRGQGGSDSPHWRRQTTSNPSVSSGQEHDDQGHRHGDDAKANSTTPGVNQDPEVETSKSDHKESQPLELQVGKLVEQKILLYPWGRREQRRRLFQASRWPQGQSKILEQDRRKHERHTRGRVTGRDQ